jgi:hypothetical protein
LKLRFLARRTSVKRPTATGLGIWVANGPSAAAQNSKKITWCLALVLTLLIGTPLFVGPAFGQASVPNGSPRIAPSATTMNHSASGLDARLTLRVYNYARIDAGLLDAAEKVASGIFEKVGVRSAWVGCAVAPAEGEAYRACESEMGTADIVLRILPQGMAKKLHASQEALGFAQACPESEPACELSVFYSRVDRLAAEGYRADRILGYVMAHEVGHILMGAAHSEEGIMRGEWSRDDLQRISWGLALDFSKNQSKQVRLAVRKRTRPPGEELSTQAKLIAR